MTTKKIIISTILVTLFSAGLIVLYAESVDERCETLCAQLDAQRGAARTCVCIRDKEVIYQEAQNDVQIQSGRHH